MMTYMYSGMCKSPKIVHFGIFCTAKYNFSVTAHHILGKLQYISDSLSYLNTQIFHLIAPEADRFHVHQHLYPLSAYLLYRSLVPNTCAAYKSGANAWIEFSFWLQYHRFTLHYSILPATKETAVVFFTSYLNCIVTPVIIIYSIWLWLGMQQAYWIGARAPQSLQKFHGPFKTSPRYEVILQSGMLSTFINHPLNPHTKMITYFLFTTFFRAATYST